MKFLVFIIIAILSFTISAATFVYQNPEHTHVSITMDNGVGHSAVYEGTRAWRKIVQPHLDSGGKIDDYVAPPEPLYEPTRDELLEELFTPEQIRDAKASIRARQ